MNMENRIKKEVIKMINNLPDDSDYDDIMAEIYFRQKIDQGLKQVKEGQTISHKEVKKRLAKWIK